VEARLRVWKRYGNASASRKRQASFYSLFFFSFFNEDHKVAVKNYAVHQSLEDPGSASQQSECNDPAPH